MTAPQDRVPVPGSERKPVAGARVVGAANPDERIDVTIVLRRRATPTVGAEAMPAPGEGRFVDRAAFAAVGGADPADVAHVEDFLHAHDLDIVTADLARRTIVASGTVASLNAAFGVTLELYQHDDGDYRGRSGSVHVPAALADAIIAVLGLDNRPQAESQVRFLDPAVVTSNAATTTSYTPPQLAQRYNFPTGVDGTGECVGIVELGGGYKSADLNTYFASLGIKTPAVVAVAVDGARNKPDNSGADGEVALDIEVVGAVAPGARIAVYFAPNTDAGFLDAITMAIHDAARKPSVISISWGSREQAWTAQALQAFDGAFQDAAVLGVTVCCASGDNGSGDSGTDGLAHVDFPASSPHVLGCGGTSLPPGRTPPDAETVWNDGVGGGSTGGGVSDVFDLPAWQKNAGVPPSVNPGGRIGRGVPDIAGDADPATGYIVRFDGHQTVIGGTSAVAPLWAGLIALLNQHRGTPVGFLNPALYALMTAPVTGTGTTSGGSATNDITSGSNGAYTAKAGWDACTGLGSPNGAALLAALPVGTTTPPPTPIPIPAPSPTPTSGAS